MGLYMTLQLLVCGETFVTYIALQWLYQGMGMLMDLKVGITKKPLVTAWMGACKGSFIVMSALMLLKQRRSRVCLLTSFKWTNILLRSL